MRIVEIERDFKLCGTRLTIKVVAKIIDSKEYFDNSTVKTLNGFAA